MHKLIGLYGGLNIKMSISDDQIAVPTFSKGWDTNVSMALDTLLRITANLNRPETERENLPARMNNSIANTILHLIVFKWANRNNRATYLMKKVKEGGNLSETSFKDLAKAWGLSLDGNLPSRMLSSIYQITGIISQRKDIETMLNPAHFVSGSEMRKSVQPPRQLVVKTGRATKIEAKGEINVLRFDNIRFLMPKERAQVKERNESSDLETEIREFDKLKVKDRPYPDLYDKIKTTIEDTSSRYFMLRRLARKRLYAIKEVRKCVGQQDIVPDSDFTSNKLVESTLKLVDSSNLDNDIKDSYKTRLNIDLFTAVFGDIDRKIDYSPNLPL